MHGSHLAIEIEATLDIFLSQFHQHLCPLFVSLNKLLVTGFVIGILFKGYRGSLELIDSGFFLQPLKQD